MLHLFLPKFREVADSGLTGLTGLTDAMIAAGALRTNPVEGMPVEFSRGHHEGDERFDIVTARRPVAESVVAAMAAATPGLTIRRGVAVVGVVTTGGPSGGSAGPVHVTGAHRRRRRNHGRPGG